MNKNFRKSIIALMLLSAMGVAHAVKLEDAAGKAVTTNPDVLAKWHQFKAMGYEKDIAWSRFLPTLDTFYGVGREHRSAPGGAVGTQKYNTEGSGIALKQNVFEGFGTVNETKRLEHATLVRYYELLDTSETAALEATKAYVDVYRFRKMMELAEANYGVHRLVFDKISERARTGVGRGVDLEFAAGRLALAESNLLTETSNLYDVTARYQRVVGETPKGEVLPPVVLVGNKLPKSRNEAVESGFQTAPALKAAVEAILAAQRNTFVQKGRYSPRVDLYAETNRNKNLDGNLGYTNTESAGVTVTFNLFRGFEDSSRVSKAVEEANVAKDVREKVCRDLRQSLSVSYNDYMRLTAQLQYLDQHKLSTDKAREAFRRQFEIGQRSLLDVLDTENEYFTASRNLVNGEMDLTLAVARYQAASGKLLTNLSLKPLDMDPPKPETELDEDAKVTCPPDPAPYPEFDKQAYFESMKANEKLLRDQNVKMINASDVPTGKTLTKAAPKAR